MAKKVRPSGITVLVLLEILTGLALLGFGAMSAILVGLFLSGFGAMYAMQVGLLLGGVFMIVGIISFVIAYGFWTGSGWARMLGLVFSGIGLILGFLILPTSLADTGILTIIFDAIIIYYLTRPHVIQFFSTTPAPSPPA